MSDGRSLAAGAVRRPRDTRILLRALDGELEGGTPALRRRLFAVICVVVACELLVILAVGTRHTADEPSAARPGEAAGQTSRVARPAPTVRPTP